MDRKSAKRIIEDYFKSWIEQDKNLFLSILHNDVIVRECTGDMYTNKNISEMWFKGWHSEGNRVLSWDISKHFFDEDSEVAIVTWNFVCIYQSKEYTFDGTSIIEFEDGLIIKLDEYQMEVDKKHPYGI